MKTIELSYLSEPAHKLPAQIESTRLELLAQATDLNAKASTMRPDRNYRPGTAEEAEARHLCLQVGLRLKIGDYLGDVVASQTGAVSESAPDSDEREHIARFPAHAWRVANSQEIEQVRRELGRIGG